MSASSTTGATSTAVVASAASGSEAVSRTAIAPVLNTAASMVATRAPQRKAATRYRVGSDSNRSSHRKVGMTMASGMTATASASRAVCTPKVAPR